MASDLNTVTVVGRLTRDAELKFTGTGLQICSFSVANNYRRKSGEEWIEETNFFDAVMMGRRAEALHKYLTKGTQIGIEGALRQNRWEKDGQTRSRVEIFVNDLQLFGSPSGSRSGAAPAGQESRAGKSFGSYSQPPAGESDEFEDDVPF